MKFILFNILFANLLAMGTLHTKASTGDHPKGDTVVIRLKNKNKVIVVTEKTRDLGGFRSIDINKILADIDSTFQGDSLSNLSERIVLRDSTMRIRRYSGSRKPRKSYQITIDSWQSDDTSKQHKKYMSITHGRRNRIDDLFEVDLGWNNYFEKGTSTLPSDNNKSYGLTPVWSNIVTLRGQKKIYWQKESTRWSNSIGLEVSWNNYKYENDVIITKGTDGVSFEPFPAEQKKIKSKLTATWLNIPIMLHYKAQKSSFHLAIGGFAGYRLESHSKTKFEENGSTKKDHVYTNFYLNSLQYGARVQIGFYDIDFFAQYNLNDLFSKDKGPALTPFAFGFTF